MWGSIFLGALILVTLILGAREFFNIMRFRRSRFRSVSKHETET